RSDGAPMPSHPWPPRRRPAGRPARHLFAACLLGAALAAGALGAVQAAELAHQGELLDRIVAVVNDGVVLQSDLDALTAQITARLRAQNVALPPENVLRSQVLEQLITEEIESQRANRAGIKVSDEQVNGALQQIARQQNVSFEDLPARLAQDGIDYTYYREQLKREIAREILQQQEVVQHIVITPRELDQYLANQQNTVSGLYEYNASNILVAIAQDASPDQIAKASALAHDIDERARRGED